MHLDEDTSYEPNIGDGQEQLIDSQSAPPDPETMVGVGALAREAYRFNWGAFLMPGVWGIVYGTWQLIALWIGSILLPFGVLALMSETSSTAPSLSALIVSTVVSETFVGGARLWSGLNANRLFWAREAMRLAIVPGAAPRHPVARFLRRQRVWAIVGAVLFVPALVANAPAAYKSWQAFDMGAVAVAEPLVWLFAELSLGAWLAYRMRVDGPDAPAPAREGA